MADATLGVMLEPANELQDEVDPVSIGVTGEGGGGDLSTAQQEQQENIVSGGVTEALATAGVFGALLSQLKSVTGFISSVLGILSRAILPAIEVLSDIIRPLVQAVNSFIANPVQTIQQGLQDTGLTPEGQEQRLERRSPNRDQFRSGPAGTTVRRGSPGEALFELFDLFPNSADQTGEQTKQQFKQNLDEAQRDKTGSFR